MAGRNAKEDEQLGRFLDRLGRLERQFKPLGGASGRPMSSDADPARPASAVASGTGRATVRPVQTSSSVEALARRSLERKRLRHTLLPLAICDGPSWNLLLSLAAHDMGERPVELAAACHDAMVPLAVGLQQIDRMEGEGLVQIVSDEQDARRSFLKTTDRARRVLTEYFEACLERGIEG